MLKYNLQKTIKNLLTNKYSYDIIKNVLSIERIAEMINVNLVMLVGSMAEQLICNQQVVGSTPITSSRGNSRVAKGGRL